MGISRTFAIVLAAVPLLGAAPHSTIRTIRTIAGDGIVAGRVGNVPARIRVDPSVVATPIVDATIAGRAGLKPSLIEFEYAIGPVAIAVESAVTRFDVGDGPEKRRVGWAKKTWAAGVDGVVGPGLLPADTIRFALRKARAGETSVAFPLVTQGGLVSQWGERFAAVPLANRTLKVQFDPHHALTIATAQAGALIAAQQGGNFTGETRSVEIAFGVKRPVRMMRLARPLQIGPFAIDHLGVRTGDFGSVAGIPETSPDPNEIVVRGNGKTKAAYDQIKLGSDVLGACSSISFERKNRRVRVDCLPAL